MNESHLQGKKVVCLGGGVGTSTLLRGLKHYGPELTIITSMADDGGSSGRLREAYNIMPPGDVVNTIAALIDDENHELAALLLHRFSGEASANNVIDGQKFGNLIMLAEMQRTGDFYRAVEVTKRIFGVHAEFLPATDERTDLRAETIDGREIESETTLDLALYAEPHGLKRVFITPEHPKVNPRVHQSLMEADIIISGPGDLYTNQLPVLIIPEIKDAMLSSNAQKLFIANIANKPFETKDFTLSDFITAVIEHLGENPFDQIYANNAQTFPMPHEYKYSYVMIDDNAQNNPDFQLIEGDLVSEEFPIYHDFKKLASLINNNV